MTPDDRAFFAPLAHALRGMIDELGPLITRALAMPEAPEPVATARGVGGRRGRKRRRVKDRQAYRAACARCVDGFYVTGNRHVRRAVRLAAEDPDDDDAWMPDDCEREP